MGVEASLFRRLLNTPPPVATSRAYALIGAMFYASGGATLLLLAAAQAGLPNRSVLAAIGVVAIGLGAIVGRRAAHFPLFARIGMNFAGTGLVLIADVLAGSGTAGRAIFWLFCYVPIDSFVFFAWRWSLLMFGWGAGATAIAAFAVGVMDPLEWAVVMIVGAAVAAVVGWLVRFGTDVLQDPATGMGNRRGLDEHLAARCADGTAAGHGFSLVAIRVLMPRAERARDGAAAVVELARRWRAAAPREATWYRMAEEDFAIIWNAVDGAEEYLARVVAQARPHDVAIGVCDFQRGHAPDRMLNEAIGARIFGARAGVGRVTRSGVVAARVEELRAAIATGEIRPFYQPVIDVASGAIVGAEALARWCRPDGTMVGPDEFVPLAEQSGAVIDLGAAILQRACRDAAAWPGITGRPMKVAVNVSGEQLHDDAFIDLVGRCLAKSGLPAEHLTLEVTESTVGGDDPRAREILAELRLMRISIAMDDFGTGYSNLARLCGLPIDVLKIDQSFVRPLGTNGRSVAIVEALSGLAARLGLTTVAEGIELPQQLALLTAAGVDQGQGYLFGRPQPLDEFCGALRELTRS